MGNRARVRGAGGGGRRDHRGRPGPGASFRAFLPEQGGPPKRHAGAIDCDSPPEQPPRSMNPEPRVLPSERDGASRGFPQAPDTKDREQTCSPYLQTRVHTDRVPGERLRRGRTPW
jgi:hypothetical protein